MRFAEPTAQIAYESLEGRPVRWQTLGTRMYWVLLPFAVAGAVLLRRRRQLLWPLHMTGVMVSVTAAVTDGQQRFRIAAEPAYVIRHTELARTVWGEEFEDADHRTALRQQITALRRKLARMRIGIAAVPSIGYRLEVSGAPPNGVGLAGTF